jgi:hypothetical protein
MMGYLMVLSATFFAALVLLSVLLGWVSLLATGEVQQDVMSAALLGAGLLAWAAAEAYEARGG